MLISEVLVKTCWSSATTAKIWNLPKIGSKTKLALVRPGPMSLQSLIELICGLTRCQESSGIPQTLILRKSLLITIRTHF